ncbi:MAG TPA: molybdopterin-synthase adenylyltransferase MoeB [Rhodothermales bacterium]|nr:molybdopterin-synthase adenylyltransferase MoeB [Rhodothermales bacterium]
MSTATLSTDAQQRYARQLILPEVGAAGQQKLAEASVLIVGAGGLGSPVALYLAAAGVGRIGLIDDDRVDVSNLHRQVLYGTASAGRPKVEAAAERLRALNPLCTVEPIQERLTPENALDLIRRFNVVADGTDSFATRYLVNDACVLAGVPNVFASISRFDGQASVFAAGGPCYRCLFESPPPPGTVPSCAEGGVLGVLPGVLGTIQATEVLKLILGIGDGLVGRLLLVDALGMRFRTLSLPRNPACLACGEKPRLRSLATFAADYTDACDPMPETPSVPEITVQELNERRQRGENPFVLDVRQPEEFAGANIDGALIPMGELADRLEELRPHQDDPIMVVHCRSGGRSTRAVEFLRSQGFTNAVNLKGGIHAWSDQIDPTLPKV